MKKFFKKQRKTFHFPGFAKANYWIIVGIVLIVIIGYFVIANVHLSPGTCGMVAGKERCRVGGGAPGSAATILITPWDSPTKRAPWVYTVHNTNSKSYLIPLGSFDEWNDFKTFAESDDPPAGSGNANGLTITNACSDHGGVPDNCGEPDNCCNFLNSCRAPGEVTINSYQATCCPAGWRPEGSWSITGWRQCFHSHSVCSQGYTETGYHSAFLNIYWGTEARTFDHRVVSSTECKDKGDHGCWPDLIRIGCLPDPARCGDGLCATSPWGGDEGEVPDDLADGLNNDNNGQCRVDCGIKSGSCDTNPACDTSLECASRCSQCDRCDDCGIGVGCPTDTCGNYVCEETSSYDECRADWCTSDCDDCQDCGNCGGDCLQYGTLVLMSDKTDKVIEDVEVGDIIKGLDINTGNIVNTRVIDTLKEHPRNNYYIINNELSITNDHPIAILKDNSIVWTRTDKLQIGDKIKSVAGIIEISSIEFIDTPTITANLYTELGNFIVKGRDDGIYVVKSDY